ncbi:helix-turn-helix domain-containing protein [Actinoallomurus sp. CA-150999]|uniref:helix-turn-helix domain-containing protein n=1 Tax=Actinoallomurus sp. CA-150999 TaxID=3239887 RepID=UPI003D92C6D5
MTCRYFGISRQAYYIWYRRYQAEGVEGLRTRSKRPKTSPNATHVEVVGKIIYLRQNYHFGPEKIAMYLKRYHDITIVPRRPGQCVPSGALETDGDPAVVPGDFVVVSAPLHLQTQPYLRE